MLRLGEILEGSGLLPSLFFCNFALQVPFGYYML